MDGKSHFLILSACIFVEPNVNETANVGFWGN